MIVATSELARHRGAVSMVDGGFEPLHAGHIAYFRAAAELGLPVLCNLSSDDYVARKHEPLLPQAERAQVIDAIRFIELVHPSQTSTADVLALLEPRYYVKGADWRGRLPQEETDLCAGRGIEVVYLDTVLNSSTAILERYGSRAEPAIDAVVTHHRDGFRSGVARFNELLAQRVGVALLGLDELGAAEPCCPLLSFKFGELDLPSAAALDAWLDSDERCYELFLHDYGGGSEERALVAGARRVNCGNSEIAAAVRDVAKRAETLWTPGLILDDRAFRPSEVSVFSFGMAHKLRTDMFRRLRELLESTGSSYAVYVSAANHETASLRDSEIVFEEMHEVFPDELYFLGNLSDVAVFNYLRSTTFYAAFFPAGVRANNTSVASALERGAVVITNLDEHSPPEYVHMENVIDIERCDVLPSDPEVLERISGAAVATGRARSWNRLAERLR